MKCYKVVRVCGKRLRSAVVSVFEYDEQAAAILDYSTEYTTTANFGGVLAFKTRDRALKFIREERNSPGALQIWRAEGYEEVEIRGWSLSTLAAMQKAWTFSYKDSSMWPVGSIAFQHLRLVSRVR